MPDQPNTTAPAQGGSSPSPLFGVWQPIATIPDGVEVLVTCGGICSPAVAQWCELEQCWIDGDDDDPRTARDEWPLTHWMPLPAPPNDEMRDRSGSGTTQAE